jgi:tetratricopeptide (TPR) repeat protein
LFALSSAAQTDTFIQIETLIRQGQFDKSITFLSQVLAKEPGNFQARNLLGIALTGKGDLTAANRQYRKILQAHPNFVPALKNLAINELTQNQVPDASKHFAAALKLAPQDPVIHAYLGKIAYSRQNYRTASDHLMKTGELVKDPTVASELIESDLQLGQPDRAREVLSKITPEKLVPLWQFRMGLLLAQHEMFSDAIPFFSAARIKTPDAYDVAFNLAVCYVETKQFPQAIEVLRGIADRGHKTAELDNLLAEAYEGNKQTQEAIDTLREAIQLVPEDDDTYVALTALCTKYESYDLALQVVEAGLHYHPQSHRLIFQRGVIYAMREKYDLAEQDFQLASQLAPEQNLSHVALGVSYMAKGDLPKAIETLRQRTKEKPNDSTLQYLLGVDLMRSGATPDTPAFIEARTALEKSVALDAKFASAHVELAKIYLKENRVDDALQHLEQAHKLDPKDKGACAQLAVAYRRKGKPELASAMLATLKQLNEDEPKAVTPQRRLRIAQEEPPPEDKR